MAIDEIVRQSCRERKEFQKTDPPCPLCGELGLLPLGGPGNYWIEHKCGAFSPLCKTLEAALASDLSLWKIVDEDLNVNMYPPVGG